ncbi:MAG TPA: type II toxin-antitoxin system VapC family toxin [Caulobacteraceae bacterium]
MKLLFDTQLLLLAAGSDGTSKTRLSAQAVALIDDPANELVFSAASIWEVAIKHGLGRADFKADPRLLRRGLLDNGYVELPIASAHAVAVVGLPDRHKDPFDRILLAQALVEGITLVTSDAVLAGYAGPIRRV